MRRVHYFCEWARSAPRAYMSSGHSWRRRRRKLLEKKVFSSNIEAREALEHRLFRPLSSNLRSEVTIEAVSSLRGHFR